MVLCKHFQQGCCRFGSKCNFEHIDIKQLVKSDVEGAINGKQYLFSCYGPFKDKASIPNFIQDQSFEEMRLLCYEARQKNYFEQFHQQLQMQAVDAMNKMKALVQPSFEVLNMLTMIYDTPVGNANQAATATNSSGNPFGLNSNATNNATTGSIFGKSNLAQVNNNGNAFGGGGIFGGGSANSMQTAGGIFGGQNSFGGQQQQQQQQQQTSIFGQPPQQQTTGSIFGGAMPKPSIFGQQQTGGIFGQSAFGNQAPNVNPFGQAPQPQQPPQNMFAQANAMLPAQQPGGNFFVQAAPQQQIQPTQPAGFFQQTGATSMSTTSMQQVTNAPQAMNQSTAISQNVDSVYSRMEDLNAEQIAAFKAEIFEQGKLPFVPPPIELINT